MGLWTRSTGAVGEVGPGGREELGWILAIDERAFFRLLSSGVSPARWGRYMYNNVSQFQYCRSGGHLPDSVRS